MRSRSRKRAATATVALSAVVLGSILVGVQPAGAADPLPRLIPEIITRFEGNAGTTIVNVPVRLSAPSDQTVTAEWETIFGPNVQPPSPATPGTDFTTASGTISFAPGETAKTVPITVIGELEVEPNESVVVQFRNPQGAALGGYFGLGFVVIRDDDQAPRLIPEIGRAPEGDTGTSTLDIPVRLSAPSNQTVTADWEVAYGITVQPPSPAVPGEDFATASGSISFAPGETTKTVPITVFGDQLAEADESIVILFSNPQGAVLGGYYGLGFGVIEDDDPQPAIALATAEVVEGDEGTTTVDLQVSLSAPTGATVTVNWQTLDLTGFPGIPIGTPGIDFETASGTVQFDPGETTQTISLTVFGDLEPEEDEDIPVAFTLPVNATLPNFITRATIVDDDTAPAG